MGKKCADRVCFPCASAAEAQFSQCGTCGAECCSHNANHVHRKKTVQGVEKKSKKKAS
jgi:hypothetical protein